MPPEMSGLTYPPSTVYQHGLTLFGLKSVIGGADKKGTMAHSVDPRRHAGIRDERGIVLPLTLLMMVVLTALTLGLLSMAAFEPVISKNLEQTTQARFAAEAGLEWAFNQVAPQGNWNQFLQGATANGVTLTSGTPMGTLSTARGTFTVVIRNDSLAGDAAITGDSVTTPEASATADANNIVILTSTGTVGTAVKSVRAVLKKALFPNGRPPGALNFPGNEAEVAFTGNSFEVDGRGYKMDGTFDSACADRWGIAVSTALPTGTPGSNEAVVESALSSQQEDNVKGKKQDASGLAEGDNTVAAAPELDPANIQAFIDQAKNAADISLASSPPSGLSFNSIGSTCASTPNDQNCWGTASNPKIVYIKGVPDPTSAFSALQIAGNSTGYGILIVEDGDLRISGNFGWWGIIIVTGQNVGVGFLGGGNQTVYGAVISNETATDPGYREGVLQGNAKLRYSCEALDSSLNNRKLTAIVGWKDLAPGE